MQFTSGGVEQEHILPPEELKKVIEKEWEEARNRETKLPDYLKPENYDPRSLYERLQQNKDKKQEEIDFQLAFKNQIKGLDDEELDFIKEKEREQEEKEAQTWEEEMENVKKFREEVTKRSDETAQSFNLRQTKTQTKASSLAPEIKKKSKIAITGLIKPKFNQIK
eukprot:Ihof_evm1s1185 gene=Ihof_evmTU1s1185